MSPLPRISIVTSSFNQGAFLARTIDSVLAQNYPDLEHIVVDGMSTDETVHVLARYPHLRVIREPDGGQAEAINKGFRHATGTIFGFLNSDDTLCPGALQRVVRAINPARGRHIVQGRCWYIDENDHFTGMEHPSKPVDRWRILQVWRTHCLPQPAIFWSRDVWWNAGPLDESLHLALDYDLFCRFGQRYRFHYLDAFLACYRLHGSSKTCSHEEDAVRELAIQLSQRYWGSRLTASYWYLALSLGWFRFCEQHQPARWSDELLARAASLPAGGWRRRGLLLLALMLAPKKRLAEWLPPRWRVSLEHWLHRHAQSAGLWQRAATPSEMLVWRSFTGVHADATIGPEYVTERVADPGCALLRLEAEPVLHPMPGPFSVSAEIQGIDLGRLRPAGAGPWRLEWPIPSGLRGPCEIRIRCSSFVTVHDQTGEKDYRPLSLRLRELSLVSPPAQARVA